MSLNNVFEGVILTTEDLISGAMMPFGNLLTLFVSDESISWSI